MYGYPACLGIQKKDGKADDVLLSSIDHRIKHRSRFSARALDRTDRPERRIEYLEQSVCCKSLFSISSRTSGRRIFHPDCMKDP